MAFLHVLISATAALLFHLTGRIGLMIIAIGCFCSWGVMHNYSTQLSKRKLNHTRGFYWRREAIAVPIWIGAIGMLFDLAGFVLLVAGILFMVRQ